MSSTIPARLRIAPKQIAAATRSLRGFFPNLEPVIGFADPGWALSITLNKMHCRASQLPGAGVTVTELPSFDLGTGYGIFCAIFPFASDGDWVQVEPNQVAVIAAQGWEEMEGTRFRLILDGTEVLGVDGAFRFVRAAMVAANVTLSDDEEARNLLGLVVGMIVGPHIDDKGVVQSRPPARPTRELWDEVPQLIAKARALQPGQNERGGPDSGGPELP